MMYSDKSITTVDLMKMETQLGCEISQAQT